MDLGGGTLKNCKKPRVVSFEIINPYIPSTSFFPSEMIYFAAAVILTEDITSKELFQQAQT